ncbi:MAG: hypothetical protein ACRC8C_02210 [Mycoplasmoidaceae bacterium]
MVKNKKITTSSSKKEEKKIPKKSDILISDKKEDTPTSDAKATSEIKKDIIETPIEPVEKIIYSKYNKFIFKTSNNNSFDKKHNSIYNFSKFGLAIVLTVFMLISLWMTTIWQKETLIGLNVNITSMNNALGNPPHLAQTVIDAMLAKNIMQFAGLNINVSIIDSIMAIGIISLVMLIPILVFRNGTLFSVISLGLGFVLLIVIMSLFFYVINAQGELVTIAREGNYLAGLLTPTQIELDRLREILDKIVAIVG